MLLESGRYPSALALAILSIEERGKARILKNMVLKSDLAGLKRSWKEYQSHRSKNSDWIMFDLVRNGARKLSDFASMIEPGEEHTAILDSLKQVAFYTDCLGKRHWSIPEEVIEKDIAASVVAIAASLPTRMEVTDREIELWVEYVKPHYAKPKMAQAVVDWQRAMCEEGLSDTSPEALEAFMNEQEFEVVHSAADSD